MKRCLIRALVWTAGAAALLIAFAAGAIRLDQYRLRWKAERLQSDIRSLELRKSTYSDARQLIERWEGDAQMGPCRPYWCDVEIDLWNAADRHLAFFLNHPGILVLYRRLGGRFASVFSVIRVREGAVWEKGMTIHVEGASIDSDRTRLYYWLIGNVATGHLYGTSAEHPEYQIVIGGGCTGCQAASVNFSSFADPKDVSRLIDINFACISVWRPCSNKNEILPAAWAEVQERNQSATKENREVCTPAVIRVLSRDAQRVPLATVIRLAHIAQGTEVTLHRDKSSKNVVFPRDYTLSPEVTFDTPLSAEYRIGDRLLLLDYPCFAVQATAENLSAARQGATEDWSTRVHAVYLPFGNNEPPKMDVR